MTYSKQFPIASDRVYLNHAAVSPWPQVTYDAVTRFAKENIEYGASRYSQWLETEHALREKLQWLINAPSTEDIAILKNTSEALSVIAYGLSWNPGDNIVLAAQEFPSNRIVWESLVQFGVDIRIVDIAQTDPPEAALLAAMDAKTRLLTSSSVHYADGLAMDLTTLGEACQANGTLFCVDAIQSLGTRPFDVQKINADFVVADGHKWMLGPEGVALFYCHNRLRKHLKLHQYGWHMVANAGDYTQSKWQIENSGKRFECGSPNMLGIQALNASLGLLQTIGLETVWTQLQSNIQHLIQGLATLPNIRLHSRADRPSGIINFSSYALDAETLYKALLEKNIICAQRGTGVRFSPHFYTSKRSIDQALSILTE